MSNNDANQESVELWIKNPWGYGPRLGGLTRKDSKGRNGWLDRLSATVSGFGFAEQETCDAMDAWRHKHADVQVEFDFKSIIVRVDRGFGYQKKRLSLWKALLEIEKENLLDISADGPVKLPQGAHGVSTAPVWANVLSEHVLGAVWSQEWSVLLLPAVHLQGTPNIRTPGYTDVYVTLRSMDQITRVAVWTALISLEELAMRFNEPEPYGEYVSPEEIARAKEEVVKRLSQKYLDAGKPEKVALQEAYRELHARFWDYKEGFTRDLPG